MGNEQSVLDVLDDDAPTVKLEERNLKSVAKLINDGKAKRIIVLTGAGLSTAAGIPDFRSPGTGLYDNLARLNLPTAESVFDIEYFRGDPNPFYVLAKELYPGNYHPTISHVFITLLAKKGLLSKLFTQNIDCLERQAGVPDELIIEAHGSFANQRCIDCKAPFPGDVMKEHIMSSKVAHCPATIPPEHPSVEPRTCGGLVKPNIVFFGESLPSSFFRSLDVLGEADLVLVLGTSLTVHPFASLPDQVENCPRVLFNMERVGSFGTRPDDVLSLGDCNGGICALADYLGWLEELNDMWREIVGNEEADRQLKGTRKKIKEDMEDLSIKLGQKYRLQQEGEDAQVESFGGDGQNDTGEAGAGTSSDEQHTVASVAGSSEPLHGTDNDVHRENVGEDDADRQLKIALKRIQEDMEDLTSRMKNKLSLQQQGKDAQAASFGGDGLTGTGESAAGPSSDEQDTLASIAGSSEPLHGTDDTTAGAQATRPTTDQAQQELDGIHVGGTDKAQQKPDAIHIDGHSPQADSVKPSNTDSKTKHDVDITSGSAPSAPLAQCEASAETNEFSAPQAESASQGADKKAQESLNKSLL